MAWPHVFAALSTSPMSYLDDNFNAAVQGAMNQVNLYVSTTGNDSNSGLNAGSPFLTIAKAAQVAMPYYLGGADVTINLAAGTYTAGAAFSGALTNAGVGTNSAGARMVILGSVSSPASYIIADASTAPGAIIAGYGANVFVEGVTISSAHGSALFPQYGATIAVGQGVVFSTCALGTCHAETCGAVTFSAGCTVSGGSPAFLEAVLHGMIVLFETAQTITLTGTPAFSVGFAHVDEGGLIYCPSADITFSGSATGPRYVAKGNGVIETNAGAATYLPGSTAGQVAGGGVFQPALALTSITGISGLGTGGAIVSVTGSNNLVGTLQLTAGTAPSSSGAFTINRSSDLGPNTVAPTFSLSTGTGVWAAGAVVQSGGVSGRGASVTVNWSNAGTALIASDTYFLNYNIQPF